MSGGEEMGVYACGHILRENRPALLVVHHRDGMRQITCGMDDHDHDVERADLHFVHARHLFASNPMLEAILETLPPGYLADCVDGVWERFLHED